MSEREQSGSLGMMMPVYCSGVDADPLEQAVHVPELQAHVLGAQAAAAAAAHAQALAQQQQLAQQVKNGGSHAGSSGRSAPSGVSGAAGTEATPSKLFMGGLSWQTSSEKLREYFGMFGPVTDELVMKDPITQRSRGFGFITFQEAASAEHVLMVPIAHVPHSPPLGMHTLDGVKIVAKHATPENRPKQPNRAKKIFVGGVSQDTSADEVKAYFRQYGTVEETVMLVDQQGFVTFVNEESVDSVCEIHFHTVKNKKVECKRVQPKEAVGSSVGRRARNECSHRTSDRWLRSLRALRRTDDPTASLG